MSEPSKSKFFTYEDGEGHVYLVDSLEQIPAKYRNLAKEVKQLRKKGMEKAKSVQREVGDVVPFVQELDLPSVAVGFAMSLVFLLVLSIVKKTGKLILKVGLLAAIVFLVAGAYFGWLRRAAGLGEDTLASPKAVIDDAKKAAGQFQKRIDDQRESLKKIEEGSR